MPVVLSVQGAASARTGGHNGDEALGASLYKRRARYHWIDVVFQPHEFFANPDAYAALLRKLYLERVL